jgi:predicted Zn finger-like uncharacterized protein
MDVRCDRCKSQYQLEDSRISEAGLPVQCPSCQYVFVVKKKVLLITLAVKPGQELSSPVVVLGSTAPAPSPDDGPEPALPPAGAGDRSREWRVRQATGNVFSLKDLTTLQKWIIERKVVRDDEISLTGDNWKRLGDIAELATFFQVLDEAQKAALLQAQAELGKALGTPAPRGPSPVGAGVLGSEPPGPVAMRRGSPLPLLLLLLLGAVGAFYYFQVLVPQREEEARAEATLREEAARQAQLRAAEAAAEAAPGAPDAGGGKDPDKDPFDAGGSLAAVAPPASPDAGNDGAELLDTGALADAGGDAGAAAGPDGGADAGLDLDGGNPPGKRPEPVRDYNYYMAQGARLRARDRFSAAAEAYGNAAELEPGRAEPYTGRGLALLDMGNPQEAAPEFEQALRLNPRSGEAIIGLAETYRSQGKKAEAVRYYQRYLETLPEGPEAEVARSAIERLMQ